MTAGSGPAVHVALAVGLTAVSTAAVLVRLVDGVSSLAIAFWRITFAAVLFAPLLLSKRRREALAGLSTSARWRLLGAGVFLGAHFALWITSLQYTSVASSVLLVTTNPIWVGLLSPWLIGERPTRRTWVGILVAMIGAVIVGFEADTGEYANPALGNALALAGGLAASGYLMMSRSVRPSLDFGAYSAATMAGAWVVLALVVVVSGVPLSGYEASAWGLFAAMALGPQLLGHGSLVWALRWVGADVVAVVLLGEPIGAAILAWYVLGEVPPDAAWMGGPLLLVGIGIVLSAGARPPQVSESDT
ncbi:MAG: EamA family transporter [Deltaproteobacteria bacterium]|nr:EamA family transporter [Deltaproteobacteria bacterium]